MNDAIRAQEILALSSRLLKQAHTTLLTNVRGEQKLRGKFRSSQNWIGGASLADFDKNKGLCYDNLTRVRTHSDLLQWPKHFLVGVEQTATEAVAALTSIIKLKSDIETLTHNSFGRRTASATLLLQELFKRPILSVDQAATICGVNYRPANELIALMCEHKILREITGQSRNRLFAFEPYLELFKLK